MAFIQRKHFQLYTETTPGEGGKTSSYEVLESIVYSSSSGSEPGNEPGNERSEVTFVVLFDCLRVGDDTQQIFRAAFAAVRDECTNVNRPIAERLRRALTQADEAVKRIVRSGDRTSSGGASIFIAALSDVKSSRGESTLKLQVTFSGNISSYWWHVDRVYSTVPQRLTIGHTWGQQNLALGLVAERDKGNYPQWHTPTQYLGAGEPIRPDLTLSVPKGRTYSTTDGLTLRPDDRVILCTVAVGHQALLDQASAGKTDARHFAKALAQRPTDTKTDRTVLLIDCRRARARVDWTTGILGFARWFGRWWWRTLLLLVVLGALGWGWQNPATVSKIYQNAKGFVTAVRMNPRESLVNPISDMFTSSATNSTPDETPTVTDE
ncbi:MAG: hypothetical protein KDE53_25705, partial [Caldilineaceae bacterium]|nr:hypothetical protein [Caldilineaceae bacterium]